MITSRKESARIEALKRYRVLDSGPEATFDRITALTASILNVPHACVTLVDEDRVWFKSSVGVEVSEVARKPGLCEVTIGGSQVHHLENALVDPLAKQNPLVYAGTLRFYAGTPLLTPDGFAIGTICAFGPEPRDLSEREREWLQLLGGFTMHELEARRVRIELERTEGALLQAQRLGSIGLVASGVAHDFNNLLGGIIGNTELLKDEVAHNSTASELVAEVDSVARRAAELVSQVLAYAGRDDDGVHVPVDLNGLVQQTGYLFKSIVHENTCLNVQLSPNPVTVEGNPASIRQLVMNLITNASESYRGQPGVVDVKITSDADWAVVCVSDEGGGLSDAARQQMYEPFFTTKTEGRGLGLAIVKRIIESYGGEIDASSEARAGTTMNVRLPLSAQCSVATGPDVAQKKAPQGHGSVLVVDDEAAILSVARRVLERAGYAVICAPNGQEAVQIAKQNDCDFKAVLLDMSMPVMSGHETLRALRNLAPELKVVLTSGHTEEQARARFGDDAINGFLKKPFGPSDLLEQIGLVVTV